MTIAPATRNGRARQPDVHASKPDRSNFKRKIIVYPRMRLSERATEPAKLACGADMDWPSHAAGSAHIG
jgi:hypothetical protein